MVHENLFLTISLTRISLQVIDQVFIELDLTAKELFIHYEPVSSIDLSVFATLHYWWMGEKNYDTVLIDYI